MGTKLKIAFWCYFTAIFAQASAGAVYLFRSEFMPYHAVAVGMPWFDVPAPFKVLILALIRIWGGASLTIALALFILLFIPFRQGRVWARRAIPILLLATYAGMSYAMGHVALNSPAEPPWAFVIGGVFLTLVSAMLSVEANPARHIDCGAAAATSERRQ